jgi:hypothetical protein
MAKADFSEFFAGLRQQVEQTIEVVRDKVREVVDEFDGDLVQQLENEIEALKIENGDLKTVIKVGMDGSPNERLVATADALAFLDGYDVDVEWSPTGVGNDKYIDVTLRKND